MKHGFSLVELSIVLVILGLLVGGILAGKSLIRAAELRTIVTQEQNYISVTRAFRDKYFALPGDMPNATTFWGVQNAIPATCKFTASTSALTCNGNGDGIVDDIAGSMEFRRYWQHLANAGLIEGGPYTGTNSLTNRAPVGKIGNSDWTMLYWGTINQPSSGFNYFNGVYNHLLLFGVPSTAPMIITPGELWNIDSKMDDGKPALGKVVAVGNTTVWATGLNYCTTTDDNAVLTADYLLTSSNIGCAVIFRQVF